jgi:hypothetical protein
VRLQTDTPVARGASSPLKWKAAERVSIATQQGTEMNATSKTQQRSPLRIALGFTGVFMLGACASVPPPTASLLAARQAISDADRAEAGRYASGELGEARAKLAAADTAVLDQKMAKAEQLADESHAEAELAAAKTANVKANAVNDEMRRSTSTLIEEMQRNSGDAQ